MANDKQIADAVRLPESLKRGDTQLDRIDSILALVEPLLGVDRAAGGRAYIRRQPGAMLFITRDPADSINHPYGHPREGHPRYRWACGDDGLDLGYLEP